MNVGEAKVVAAGWVAANVDQWPGLCGAHLVGGITTLPDDARWPVYKDVDLHLIFAEGSPALEPTGPFLNILEVPYQGLLLEAGIKSIVEYHRTEDVLANPEIAHHLTVDSLLYDPDGLLHDLQGLVRARYACRRWVKARLDYERLGLAGAFEMLPMARAISGASGEALIIGYTSTFIAAALCVATLAAPTTGSRAMLRVRDVLTAYGRPDLYESFLAVLGLIETAPDQVAAFLKEGEAAFDLAVAVRRTPHPFQHKLHAHLKPYFVDSCRTLLAEGYHREALHWLTPFYHASTDVILADAPEADKKAASARHARFLAAIGMNAAQARAVKLDAAHHLYADIFALADEIVATHPDHGNCALGSQAEGIPHRIDQRVGPAGNREVTAAPPPQRQQHADRDLQVKGCQECIPEA